MFSSSVEKRKVTCVLMFNRPSNYCHILTSASCSFWNCHGHGELKHMSRTGLMDNDKLAGSKNRGTHVVKWSKVLLYPRSGK